jgi:hypothetical protein
MIKKLFELFDDTKDNGKKSRKKQIIKDTVKNAARNNLSGKKDVFDPDPDLTVVLSVK